MFNISEIRKQFPILEEKIDKHPLIYFDNAATTQKPLSVIHSITNFYQKYNANVYRGVYQTASKATFLVEETRAAVSKFIKASRTEEIIFTKNTTESINLVAHTYGEAFLEEGDEIIISQMEHHSNIIPWQIIAERKKSCLKYIPFDSNGLLDLKAFRKMLSAKTKIVSIVYASNVLGTINPIKQIIKTTHEYNAIIMIDAAQAVAHLPIDVQELGCDFLVFSAHKLYGPLGVGILYGKYDLLNQMPAYQTGGGMMQKINLHKSTYQSPPYKFEAGTLNIVGIVAFKEAIRFIEKIQFKEIINYEDQLIQYVYERITDIPDIKYVGVAKERVSLVSLQIPDIHHLDITMFLDTKGIAIRSGDLCSQLTMQYMKVEGAFRLSFGIYNKLEEIEICFDYLKSFLQRLKR